MFFFQKAILVFVVQLHPSWRSSLHIYIYTVPDNLSLFGPSYFCDGHLWIECMCTNVWHCMCSLVCVLASRSALPATRSPGETEVVRHTDMFSLSCLLCGFRGKFSPPFPLALLKSLAIRRTHTRGVMSLILQLFDSTD